MTTRAELRPTFGADDAFERRLFILRRVVWAVVAIALLAFGAQQLGSGSWQSSASLRALVVYGSVWFFLRLAGKRTLGEMTTFDLVIVLVLSEAIQPSLVGEDATMLTGIVLCATLVGADVIMGVIRFRRPALAKWIDDVPTVLVYDGRPCEDALKRSRVDIDDVLEASRAQHGIIRLRDIRFAIMERSGGISIVKWGGQTE